MSGLQVPEGTVVHRAWVVRGEVNGIAQRWGAVVMTVPGEDQDQCHICWDDPGHGLRASRTRGDFETYLRNQQMVVDRVTGIANRRHNGLYVWGETGVGKTFSIERTLEEAQTRGLRSYRKLEGKCTPVGLFELARDFPDHILFIDDDPMLVQDRLSQQILLHLCGDGRIDPETGRNVRTITNVKSKGRERCQFTGSVVITNNVRLANMPVLRALQGRIRTYHFRPTTSELVAMLRHLAEAVECPEVDLEERREICEFIIAECEHSQQQLDLRLLKHAISDYIQWKRGEVKVHWRQLVVSSLRITSHPPRRSPERTASTWNRTGSWTSSRRRPTPG